MNKNRRATLNQALEDIKGLKNCTTSDEAMEKADLIKDTVDMVRDDEECAYDLLPENLQMSSRGDDMQDNISDLEEAMDSLDEFICEIEGKEYDYDKYRNCLVNAVNKITEAIER